VDLGNVQRTAGNLTFNSSQAYTFVPGGSSGNLSLGTNSVIAGLTQISFNANPVKTRPAATLGAYYNIRNNQRLAIKGIYKKEPFQSVSTISVMATYSIGL
jgi:hypothetical protein